jgi:hypothetical protein
MIVKAPAPWIDHIGMVQIGAQGGKTISWVDGSCLTMEGPSVPDQKRRTSAVDGLLFGSSDGVPAFDMIIGSCTILVLGVKLCKEQRFSLSGLPIADATAGQAVLRTYKKSYPV